MNLTTTPRSRPQTITEYDRQLDIFDPRLLGKTPITVIGVGGIGSPTVLALSKMGFHNIHIVDGDSVEPHNLPNQLYPVPSLGEKKVDALAQVCRDFSEVDLKTTPEMFSGQFPLQGIIISGLDSMEARQLVWDHIKFQPEINGYIDGRMGAQVGIIHTLDPRNKDQVTRYEATLYTDDEADDAPCTARAISYNVFVIAGLIAAQASKFAKGETPRSRTIIDLQNFEFFAED